LETAVVPTLKVIEILYQSLHTSEVQLSIQASCALWNVLPPFHSYSQRVYSVSNTGTWFSNRLESVCFERRSRDCLTLSRLLTTFENFLLDFKRSKWDMPMPSRSSRSCFILRFFQLRCGCLSLRRRCHIVVRFDRHPPLLMEYKITGALVKRSQAFRHALKCFPLTHFNSFHNLFVVCLLHQRCNPTVSSRLLLQLCRNTLWHQI